MSQRIEARFAALKQQNRKGLVTFIMGGDPDLEACSQILHGLPAAGADLIEIGMPFSDPMADGAVIEAAGLRALKAGTCLMDILEMVERFRETDAHTPIILMGYYNPIYRFGVETFCIAAQKAGVDGVIIVDLPPEEEEEFIAVAQNFDIKLIRLVAPTTDAVRFQKLVQHAGGFIYYISIAGITGAKAANMETLEKRVTELKTNTNLPIAVGFGIKTPRQVKEVAAFADAVVVGSALVEKIANETPQNALAFVKSLRKALD